MCALRAIAVPELPDEQERLKVTPGQAGTVGANAGIFAIPILPGPAGLTRNLTIIQFSTKPGGLSETHHHGGLDTCVYVMRGTIGFKCGVGMKDYVAMREGELGFIAPQAVHAENNPETDGWSTGLSIREIADPTYFPCEAPSTLPGGRTGLNVVPRPAQMATVAPAESDQALGALSTHHLRARRLALDRIEIAPASRYAPPHAALGETALMVIAGRVLLRDGGSTPEGGEGSWWYLEEGTQWTAENSDPLNPAEILLVRSSS